MWWILGILALLTVASIIAAFGEPRGKVEQQEESPDYRTQWQRDYDAYHKRMNDAAFTAQDYLGL